MNLHLEFSPPIEEMAGKWRELARNGIWEALGRGANDINDFFLLALINEAPKATGTFASQIRADIDSGSQGAKLRYMAPDPLASWIIDGTPPHIIEPVNAQVLRFLAADGQIVFATRVEHPGTAPNDFVSRAYDIVHSDLMAAMRQIGKDIIDQVIS